MSLFLSSSLIRSSGVVNIKKYGDKYKVTWCKSVRKKGYEKYLRDEYDGLIQSPFDGSWVSVLEVSDFIPESNNKLVSDVKLSNNISRAKSKVFEYAYYNHWDYFITLTISPDKYDRYDLKAYIKDLGKFINNYNTVHHSKISYVLIPEQHKDGAWHMHGLISGILSKHLETNKNGYLDFPMYARKFGFCSLSSIKNHEAVCKYITKYVTKELFSRSCGERCYYCSKGLKKAELLFRLEDCNPDFIKWDFEHEDGFCKTAMTDSLDFMQNICINK